MIDLTGEDWKVLVLVLAGTVGLGQRNMHGNKGVDLPRVICTSKRCPLGFLQLCDTK